MSSTAGAGAVTAVRRVDRDPPGRVAAHPARVEGVGGAEAGVGVAITQEPPEDLRGALDVLLVVEVAADRHAARQRPGAPVVRGVLAGLLDRGPAAVVAQLPRAQVVQEGLEARLAVADEVGCDGVAADLPGHGQDPRVVQRRVGHLLQLPDDAVAERLVPRAVVDQRGGEGARGVRVVLVLEVGLAEIVPRRPRAGPARPVPTSGGTAGPARRRRATARRPRGRPGGTDEPVKGPAKTAAPARVRTSTPAALAAPDRCGASACDLARTSPDPTPGPLAVAVTAASR